MLSLVKHYGESAVSFTVTGESTKVRLALQRHNATLDPMTHL